MKIKIDRDWQFRRDDGTFVVSSANDWKKLDLPHDWAIEGEFSKENYIDSIREEAHLEFRHDSFLPRGCGMYRKQLAIEELFPDQRVFLEFDGVFGESTLFVNGRKGGENTSGYTGTVYDITKLCSGKRNVELILNVSAERMQGWWYEGAGIYRHVWLHRKPACHIVPWGIAVTTPRITDSEAEVNIAVELKNCTAVSENAELEFEIFDPDGKSVAKKRQNCCIENDGEITIESVMQISAPRLWDVDAPELYSAKITLSGSSGRETEEVSFGIRYFEFTPDKGFFLNGRRIQLRGGNLHHDFGGLGTALPDRAHEKNVEVLKNMGANMIRSSHNPAAPALMEACDRMGMLLWAETRNLHPERGAEKDLTALIRRDRNHPSIVLWSLANTAGAREGNRYLTDKLKVLHDLVKKLDPSRPTAVGLEGNADANANGFADTVDVVGYNGGGMGKDDRDHEMFPQRCMAISEYSSGRGARGIYKEEEMGESGIFETLGDGRKVARNGKYCSEIALLESHCREWTHVMERPFLAGGLMWSAIEYRGETCGFPVVTSQFGVLDICRFPKDTFYYYQMLWRDEPMIHVFPPWNRNVPDGTEVELFCCTNCDSVELLLNGRKIDVQQPQKDKYVKWLLPYEAGTLEAVGSKDGKEICRQTLTTPGVPAELKITADRSIITANGEDIAFLRADVVDSCGNIIPDAAEDLEITVTGAGKLAGVCSGDPSSHEREDASTIRTFSGAALVIIQSGDTPGDIMVEISGRKVGKNSVSLKAE